MGTRRSNYRNLVSRRPEGFAGWGLAALLWPLSLLYRGVVWLRGLCYRVGLKKVYRAKVPVISVGNLTVGGTGKTPFTDMLVRNLLQRGFRVAVVSRGYGGGYSGDVGVVSRGAGELLMPPREAGDEPCLLAARNPALRVYVARRRRLGVQAAEADGAQAIVLDDGFQHLAVHRDLDIVLLDARAPFGNGLLLPAGPLREAAGALRRAGLVAMTHAGHLNAVPPRDFSGPFIRCRHQMGEKLLGIDGSEVSWDWLQGREVVAFAGIARPEDFFSALRQRGIKLAETISFDDHQVYTEGQLNLLLQTCDNNELLITTEKDAVKLRAASFPCPCLAVPVTMVIDDPTPLEGALDQLLEKVT